MTRAVRLRGRRPRLGLQLAGLRRRSWADRWPLLLTTAVVALTALLTVVTPRLVARTADESTQDAVRDAGSLADTSVALPFSDTPYGPELRRGSAADSVVLAERLDDGLPPELAPVLAPPAAAVVSRTLTLGRPVTPELGELGLRLAWVWAGGQPAVTWLDGVAPGPPVPPPGGAPAVIVDGPPPYPVQIALAEDGAATLGVGVGDHLGGEASSGYTVDLVVTGVFRADAPDDPAWAQVPTLLEPRTGGAEGTTETTVAALLSDASLPAARLALPEGDVTRSVTFAAAPAAFDAASADTVPRAIATVQAAPYTLGVAPAPRVTSRLGLVLVQAQQELRAAQAQAAVALAGVVAVAALTLLSTAQLLARRRRTVLATQRARGASLAGIGVELAVESVVVAVVGVAAGVLLGGLLLPGATPGGRLLLLLLIGAVAGPVCGVLVAARATGGRRVAANRQQRRGAVRDQQLRRLAVEAVVVLLAAGTIAALRLRGVLASAADPGGDLLLAMAPTLGLVAGALVLLRLFPVLLQVGLRAVTRTRRAVPLLAAVQARSSGGAVLPLLTLTLATGLVAGAATLGVTLREGQVDASWTTVGSDVTVTTEPDPGLTALAAGLAARPGVDLVVPARVLPGSQVRVTPQNSRATLLVVDEAEFAELLRSTPLPDTPALDRLGDAGAGGVPALIGAGVPVRGDAEVSVLWNGDRVLVSPVGVIADLGGQDESTVVLDAAALGAVVGGEPVPDTLWLVGPGAAAAVAATPELAGADVRDRQDWLADQRAAPLTRGVTQVAAGSAVVLLVLGVAGLLLGAAAGAPQRGRTLATLRTLGLTGAQARRISLGELLPPVLAASLAGTGLGIVVAGLVRTPLELRLLTGQAAAPDLVVPAWVAAGVLPLVLAVLAVVAVESSARRRERLGEVLRVG